MKNFKMLFFTLLSASCLWSSIHDTNITEEQVRKCFAAIRYARNGTEEEAFLNVWQAYPPRMKRFKVDTFRIFGIPVSEREEYGHLIDDGTGTLWVAMPGANLLRNLGVLKSGKADLQTASRQTPTFNHTEIGGTGSTGKGGCQTGYLGMYCSCSEEIRKFGEAFDEGKPKKVIFTGHSLGAALSQLGAFDLRNHFNLKEKKQVQLVTFGSPRVYNSVSSELFDKYIGKKIT